MLGSVFLVVTVGEALYADMGHFGRGPIRIGWYAVVFPSLLLSYFGQGATLAQVTGKVVDIAFYTQPAGPPVCWCCPPYPGSNSRSPTGMASTRARLCSARPAATIGGRHPEMLEARQDEIAERED